MIQISVIPLNKILTGGAVSSTKDFGPRPPGELRRFGRGAGNCEEVLFGIQDINLGL